MPTWASRRRALSRRSSPSSNQFLTYTNYRSERFGESTEDFGTSDDEE